MEYDNKIGENKNNEKIIEILFADDGFRRILTDFIFIDALSGNHRSLHCHMVQYNNKTDNF